MAGNNGKEIRVAGTGRVLIAPVGTDAPATIATDWDKTKWTDLGYTTTDGIKFNKKDKIDPVDTWQSVSPARFIYSDRDLTVKFQLLQLNKANLAFFMGGGEVKAATTPAVGTLAEGDLKEFTYDLANSPAADERALGIEFTDGAAKYRFVVPRGQVTETEEIGLTRTGAVKLGVTFTALAKDDNAPLASFRIKELATSYS
ncbi:MULTISPECIES: phage tail protein [Streptomyces]|uniref:Phage tail protein n=1 Tax=Streptomyces venezuelae TaxID=54571 RepID=A0A5P2CID3_STRVZ|nr:phage tail protein [Streptomyces venezuelae]QES42525.1 phage tail protein [Streptomyces venezuelae]